MKKCLLCEQIFQSPFSFLDIFSWQKQRESKICSHCLHKFEILQQPRCKFCAKSLNHGEICRDCEYWQKIYGNKLLLNHALYRYNTQFHDLMVAYKRYGDYALREVLQELCYQELGKMSFDYYVPIPTSPEHQQKRQFDTIEAIFQDLVPLTRILIKEENSGAQAQRNKKERLASKQSFLIAPNFKVGENMNTASFLLLDDIYTTGRTLYHARDKILSILPQAKVESFTICH